MMIDIGPSLMHTLASDLRAVGKENYEMEYDNCNNDGFDIRPDMDLLSLELYLGELKMSRNEYERRFS